MDAFLGVKYVMTHAENYSEYLQYIGVDKDICDYMLKIQTFFRLDRTPEGKYRFNVSSEFGDIDYIFKVGEEFDEMGYDNGTNNTTTLPVSPSGAGLSWIIKLKKFGDYFKKIDPTIINVGGRAVVTIEGNILTMIQRSATGKVSKIVAEYYADRMLITTTALGFNKTVKRYFKAVL